MNRFKNKILYILVSIMLCSLLFSTAVFANSAPVFITAGEAARGVIPREELPLTVEKEILTFDIQKLEMEETDYDVTEAADHSGTVTAEYYFNNPTKETITTKLAFAHGVERVNTSCEVRLNGEPVESEIRYTYIGDEKKFYGPEDVRKIRDDYEEDDFFHPEMPVTKYVFNIKYPSSVDVSPLAGFYYSIPEGAKARIMIPVRPSQSGIFSRSVENGEAIDVYVFGETDGVRMEWQVNLPTGEVVTALPEKESEMTLLDFAALSMKGTSGISAVDSYNTVIDGMNERRHFDIIPSFLPEYAYDTTMWIEYELTIGPEETAVNSVKAILSPEWYNYKKNPQFTYHYLLSPAKSWKQFGSIDVIINTPHKLYGNSDEGFEETETGYKRHFDVLPDGELSFCLTPEDGSGDSGSDGHGGAILGTVLIAIIVIVAAVFFFGILVIVIVLIVNGKKSRKKDKEVKE